MVTFTKQQLQSMSKLERQQSAQVQEQQAEYQRQIQEQQQAQLEAQQKAQEDYQKQVQQYNREKYEWEVAEKFVRNKPELLSQLPPSIQQKARELQAQGVESWETIEKLQEPTYKYDYEAYYTDPAYSGGMSTTSGEQVIVSTPYQQQKSQIELFKQNLTYVPSTFKLKSTSAQEYLFSSQIPEGFLKETKTSQVISPQETRSFITNVPEETQFIKKTPFSFETYTDGKKTDSYAYESLFGYGVRILEPITSRIGYWQDYIEKPQYIRYREYNVIKSVPMKETSGFIIGKGFASAKDIGVSRKTIFDVGSFIFFYPAMTTTSELGANLSKQLAKQEETSFTLIGQTSEISKERAKKILNIQDNTSFGLIQSKAKDTGVIYSYTPINKFYRNEQGRFIGAIKDEYMFTEKLKISSISRDKSIGSSMFEGYKISSPLKNVEETYFGSSAFKIVKKDMESKIELFTKVSDKQQIIKSTFLSKREIIPANLKTPYFKLFGAKGEVRLLSQETFNIPSFPANAEFLPKQIFRKKQVNIPLQDLYSKTITPFTKKEWLSAKSPQEFLEVKFGQVESAKLTIQNRGLFSDIKYTFGGGSISRPIELISKKGSKTPLVFEEVMPKVLKKSKPLKLGKVGGGGRATTLEEMYYLYPQKQVTPLKYVSEEELIYSQLSGVPQFLSEKTTPTFNIAISPKAYFRVTEQARIQDKYYLPTSSYKTKILSDVDIKLKLEGNEIIKSKIALDNKNILEQKNLLESKNILKQKNLLELKLKQEQIFSQKSQQQTKSQTKSRTLDKVKFVPKPPKILTPPTSLSSIKSTATPKQKKALQKAYQVFVKRRGKYSPLDKILPRGRAILLGRRVTESTLGASFKIKEAGTTQLPDVPASFSPRFRTYKIRKGKRIPLKDTFIQKRKFRLSSKSEVSEIMSAKKSKRRLKLL